MKDKKLEDVAWRLIAEARAGGNKKLFRCASALREMGADRDATVAPHALVGSADQKPLGKV